LIPSGDASRAKERLKKQAHACQEANESDQISLKQIKRRRQMSKKNLLLVLEIVLLVAVSSSFAGCGGSYTPSQATPRATAPQHLDTGPPDLPLYCPVYIKHDQQGNIYASDSDAGEQNSHRARIVKLSSTGQLLAEWHVFNTFQIHPSSFGTVTGPYGLAVDTSGTIYVGDAGDNTIKKLSPAGKVLATWGKTGSAPGELSWPEGVAVDAQGNVYVADFNNSRIQKFSSTGTLLAIFGNTGSSTERLKNPVGIDVDPQGDLYVTDLRNHRIVKFSSEGKFLTAWSGAGGKQFSSARDVTVDRAGNIYIADARNSRIVKFSPTGQLLAIWGRVGLGLFGLTVDPQGNIYVAIPIGPGGEIRKLSPSGALLASWPATCLP
jgi:DNA-binding beta-propeller fold protein YncE